MAITEERVKALMKRRGIENVTDLAQASGVGRSHLYQVWKADGAASLATIRHLARALGVTIGELIGEGEPARTPYHENADIRALADLLATRPLVARHMIGAVSAMLGEPRAAPVEDNILEFVPARAIEAPKEMTDVELRAIATALGEVVEFRKGSLWKEYEVPLVATLSPQAQESRFSKRTRKSGKSRSTTGTRARAQCSRCEAIRC